MPDCFVQATDSQGGQKRFRIQLAQDGDHWVATCDPVDEHGMPTSGGTRVAPLFYGIHEDQAKRRMITALENQYAEVVEVPPPA